MTVLTCDDIRMEIRATLRRLQDDVNAGRIHDDFILAASDLYNELLRVVIFSIEEGHTDDDCDWSHYCDMVWARYDVEDMLKVLQSLMEIPRWD